MNVEPMTRFSGIPRVFDPALRNHQWIMGLSVAAGLVGFGYGLFVQAIGLLQAFLLAVMLGASAFVAWVQGRELDPDHPVSGLLGPVLVVPAVLLLGRPNLLAGFWIILALRILNRSTGLPAKPLDSLGMIALTGWLAYSAHPVFAPLAGLVLLADGWLPEGHPYHRPLGALVLVGGGVYWILGGARLGGTLNSNWLIGAGIAAAFFLLAVAMMEAPAANCDFVDKTMSNTRERAAQGAALILALTFLAFQGEEGLIGQIPLWSTMVGIAGYQIARKLS